MTVTVLIMFHSRFMTKVDRAYYVQCFYMEADKTVTAALDVRYGKEDRTYKKERPTISLFQHDDNTEHFGPSCHAHLPLPSFRSKRRSAYSICQSRGPGDHRWTCDAAIVKSAFAVGCYRELTFWLFSWRLLRGRPQLHCGWRQWQYCDLDWLKWVSHDYVRIFMWFHKKSHCRKLLFIATIVILVKRIFQCQDLFVDASKPITLQKRLSQSPFIFE